MSTADLIQLGMLAIALIGGGLGLINRWAVANKHDQLASFTSAAGNAAGRIRETLNGLPSTADTAAIKRQLVQAATVGLLTEFSGTAAKLGATAEKVTGIIAGQLGQIPPTVIVPVVISGSLPVPAPVT